MAQLFTVGPAHWFISFPTLTAAPVTSTLQATGNSPLATDRRQVGGKFQNRNPAVNSAGAGLLLTPGPLQYLGTCEVAPYIVLRPAFKPVFNQLGGGMVPFDLTYHGEEGFSFLDLNRFNEAVVAALQARPFSVLGARGLNLPGDIGTLCLTEGGMVQVYVFFPYVAKLAFAAGLMPPGYKFVASVLFGPDEMRELGIDPRKNILMFRHLRVFDPSTGVFSCYDHNVGTMPAIN